MAPDLRNLITITGVGTGLERKVIVRHREFPEIQAEGKLTRDAALALLSILRRSSGWSTDALHTAELDKAISDVESLLWVLDRRDISMINRGKYATIMKNEDLVYYWYNNSTENSAVPANRVDDRSKSAEPQGDGAAADSVLVYSVGRRRASRRQPANADEAGPVPIERRQLDRRKMDRRECKRISLIANIPKSSDEFRSVGMESADFSTNGCALPN